MANRFVILHHQSAVGEHWDLMLEKAHALMTWQLLHEPKSPADLPIPARRIADHRKAYLDYEGPISGDRGTVRQVDAGTVEVDTVTGGSVRFHLSGARLCGNFVIRTVGDDGWLDHAPPKGIDHGHST